MCAWRNEVGVFFRLLWVGRSWKPEEGRKALIMFRGWRWKVGGGIGGREERIGVKYVLRLGIVFNLKLSWMLCVMCCYHSRSRAGGRLVGLEPYVSDVSYWYSDKVSR